MQTWLCFPPAASTTSGLPTAPVVAWDAYTAAYAGVMPGQALRAWDSAAATTNPTPALGTIPGQGYPMQAKSANGDAGLPTLQV